MYSKEIQAKFIIDKSKNQEIVRLLDRFAEQGFITATTPSSQRIKRRLLIFRLIRSFRNRMGGWFNGQKR